MGGNDVPSVLLMRCFHIGSFYCLAWSQTLKKLSEIPLLALPFTGYLQA